MQAEYLACTLRAIVRVLAGRQTELLLLHSHSHGLILLVPQPSLNCSLLPPIQRPQIQRVRRLKSWAVALHVNLWRINQVRGIVRSQRNPTVTLVRREAAIVDPPHPPAPLRKAGSTT